MVGVAAAIVPDGRADRLRDGVDPSQQLLDVTGEVRMVFHGGIEVVDIGGVVLVVVDLHRLRVDGRFQGPVVVGQRR